MDNIITELIAMVKESAPALWAMARMQVAALNQADTVASIIMGVIMLLLIAWCVYLHLSGDNAAIILIIAIMGILPLAVIIGINIYMIFMRTANPDYYAIQVLLQLAQ